MNTHDAIESPVVETVGAAPSAASTSEPFYVVGVGASAGGLEALEQFFDHMPEDSRLCFVVVQHLSPDFKSMMDELLARRTRIPIVRVEDGIELRPNTIFLMPPRKEMIQSAGRLFLTDKDPSQGFALPIDRYLRSLAQDIGSRSIGVILSGTGSDGSRGIRDIHEAGGLVVAQSEESAKFDGMPRSARETGLVDLVLSAADMPDAILKLVRLRRLPDVVSDTEPSVPEVGLQAIFRMLRAEYGIDFSQYKPSTVTRRVERRLLLNQSLDVEQYVDRLAENRSELNQLYKDLLIGVTQFFRDREAFHRLFQNELPRLLAAVEDDQEFRVWVAGCATGEEAYSLAILIHEHLATMSGAPMVRIFATDAHRASLDFASAGIYSEEALTAVSLQRREQFFIRKGDGFQVVPHIRKMIVFAPHDLLKDAPFTRLDLVSCRNLLIYLQPSAQKKVLSLFHFGLKAGGVLFLGPSESPGDLSDEFESVDEHWKLYRKRRDVRLRPDFRLLLPSGPPARPRINSSFASSSAASDRLQQAVYSRLLEEHMPPSFLINDRKELVHSFGGAGKYLRVRDGRATTQLLDLVDSELKMILLGALARVEKQLVPVVFTGIRVPCDDGGESLTRLTVKPLPDRVSGLTSYLIILEEMVQHAPPRDEATIDMGAASLEQVQTLEQELLHTRENLQAMIEEQESSNEELQSTNEELVASNEELQSTNEELHSVNEELYTVNAEYQHKIEELTQVTADLENLLLATDVGILFLDRKLCIRRFTPRVGKLFNLLPQDIGRPITGFTNLLDEPLIESLRQVLDNGTPVEKEIHDRDGNCYFMRILSYRISAAALDGVVLSLVDISPLRKAEARLQHLSSIVESSDDAIVSKDLNGRILSWNRGAEQMYGYSAEEAIGCNARMLYPPESAGHFDTILGSIRAGHSITGEHQRQRRDGTIIDVLHTTSPIRDSSGRVIGASGIARDITSRKQAERDIQQAIRNRDQFLAMLSHELRNPLGAILNAARLLERVAPPDDQIFAASRVVYRQAEQMRLLLDDLLDVARVTQNKIVLRQTACLISDIISDAIETVQPLLVSRGQRLVTEGLPSPLCVYGDPARLQQVVINLVKNAAKYSPPEHAVFIRLDEEDGRAVIRVQDHGVGIPADMLDHVFDLFVQSNETLDRADGGMGVGLTLVKAIVEYHGGSVTAKSPGRDQGSEFTVRLPLLVDSDSAGPANDRRTATPTRTPRKLRIAVIEDNADSRNMLQSLLQLDENEVRTAPDGVQGIELVKSWQPDVAIVDIGLPGLDGFEVARQIRSARLAKTPRLIALTGYGFASDREKALAAGFDTHLVKPLKLHELHTAMERAG
ncbi:MAG: PAS domain S-box protein [Planctomycetes bacterium]|nr:PAS domain S-box protein [Planctomycetota bacterium]